MIMKNTKKFFLIAVVIIILTIPIVVLAQNNNNHSYNAVDFKDGTVGIKCSHCNDYYTVNFTDYISYNSKRENYNEYLDVVKYGYINAKDYARLLKEYPEPIEDDGLTHIIVNVNGKSFDAILYDTKAATQFAQMMPITMDMSELNGNEKYYYMNKSLTTSTERIGTIHEGDLLMWGSNCMVLFYDTFNTSYSYTKIGYITDTTGLKEAVGNDDVTVTFNLK